MRLVVPPKTRQSFCNIRPFCKAFSPPGIIFGNWVVLREVEGNETSEFFFHEQRINECIHCIQVRTRLESHLSNLQAQFLLRYR
jgi:hypothetical protein